MDCRLPYPRYSYWPPRCHNLPSNFIADSQSCHPHSPNFQSTRACPQLQNPYFQFKQINPIEFSGPRCLPWRSIISPPRQLLSVFCVHPLDLQHRALVHTACYAASRVSIAQVPQRSRALAAHIVPCTHLCETTASAVIHSFPFQIHQ